MSKPSAARHGARLLLLAFVIFCITLSAVAQAQTQTFYRYLSYAYNIVTIYTPMHEAFATFYVSQPSRVEVSGHIVLKHRGNLPSDHYRVFGDDVVGSGPIGVGCRGALRGPGVDAAAVNVYTTVNSAGPVNPPPQWMKGAKVADNLMSLERHYIILPLNWSANIPTAGWYRKELWCVMHGSRYGNGTPNCTPTSCPAYPLPWDFSAVEVNRSGVDTDGPDLDPYNNIRISVHPL